jgi:hypothetical protein
MPNGVYDNHPLGVFYSAPNWYIFHEDRTPIQSGAAFNVILAAGDGGFVQVATSANTHSNDTLIDDPGLNGQPGARLFVTPDWNPDGNLRGVYNDHPLGVGYNRLVGRWYIFNQDGAPIPSGSAFNVQSFGPSLYDIAVGTHYATSANSYGDYTVIDNPYSGSATPDALVWVTSEFIPSLTLGGSGVSDAHTIGVFYDGSHWCIFHQDGTPIPNGAAFLYQISFP